MVEGIELDEMKPMKTCDACAHVKSTRKPIRKEREKPQAKAIGDKVHSDLWGPTPVRTPQHKEYYVSFMDDYSWYTHLYLIQHKDDTFEVYKAYEALINTQYEAKIKILHTDRGGEFLGHEFANHLSAVGTIRNLTVHDTPEHNGIAEWLNHTLLEKVCAMLHVSGLPQNLWGEAVKHAIYLKNRTSI
jgi:Integrase core domain.